MPLKVLLVAYPFAAVGPDAVGGAEQICAQLDAALCGAGHESVVVACEGSVVRGRHVAVPAVRGDIASRAVYAAAHRAHGEAIGRVLREERVDVVHMHGIDFHAYLPREGPPVLVTLHLPPAWYAAEAFGVRRGGVHFHCVSASQQRACPRHVRMLPPIGNGVAVEAFGAHVRKRRYAVALGRVCAEKNLHVALEAGRMAGMPVLLGGAVYGYPEHRRYFAEEIVPRLDGQRRFLGPVGFARKRRLLCGARCLLLPTVAPETSSLVAMEALAAGTPVVAYASGAVPEIVEDGVTGFLVRDAGSMADAMKRCGEIDPAACRAAARARFSLDVMVQRYMSVYERLADDPGAVQFAA